MRLFASRAFLPEGWASDVLVDVALDGTIASVTTEVDRSAADADERADVLLAGMPNVHSHAFQRAMAGRAERRAHARDDFWTWRDAMYALANELDPDRLYAIARDAYATMLAAGYTSVAEFHYLHRAPGGAWYDERAAMSLALVAAARDVGIAIALLPALYAHGDAGGTPLDARRARFETSVDEILALSDDVRRAYANDRDVVVGVCAHSLRAVTPDELRALVDGGPADVPIHLHIAEQEREVEAVSRALGARPVAWLLANFDVDARWCLVHATHLDDGERRGLARGGAIAGLCPTTEANLGDGLFPLAAYLDDGGALAIGSDSNASVSVVEELRWLEYGQRLVSRSRQIAARRVGSSCAETLYRAACVGGARALGRAAGRIAVGARADFVALAAGEADPDALDRYVFAAIPGGPTATFVAGRRTAVSSPMRA